jgi:hypothetical protein
MKKDVINIIIIVNSVPEVAFQLLVMDDADRVKLAEEAEGIFEDELSHQEGVTDEDIQKALENGYYNNGSWGIWLTWTQINLKEGSPTTDRARHIEYIKGVIEEHGELSCADMEADSSPCINVIGDTAILLEHFGLETATAITYVGSMETNEVYINYEDLADEVLVEISQLMEGFDLEQYYGKDNN